MATQVDDDAPLQGAKTANIQVAVTYPIVSAFEFEFLKAEPIIRERLDNCTVYLLVQRALTYFDNVILRDGAIFLEIADGVNPPMACRIDLVDAEIIEPGEGIDVEVSYFVKTDPQPQPFRQVASIRLYRSNGDFILWWSPQKLLFEILVRGLRVGVAEGADPLAFTDFTVLYVGKAFDQKVWDRLTGHTKMQKIMTVQSPIGASAAARAPFEVSLVLLTVVGLTEAVQMPYLELGAPPGVKPVLHDIDLDDEEAFVRFMTQPFVPLRDEAMTREVEAQLIHRFRPEHNTILFKEYPEIEGGMRSRGYTWTELEIEGMPASLSTEHFSIAPVVHLEFEEGSDA